MKRFGILIMRNITIWKERKANTSAKWIVIRIIYILLLIYDIFFYNHNFLKYYSIEINKIILRKILDQKILILNSYEKIIRIKFAFNYDYLIKQYL
jgi:hypothetical protein